MKPDVIPGRKSLVGRMLTANILTAGLSTIVLTALFLVNARTGFQQQQRMRARLLAQVIGRQINVPVLTGDEESLKAIADQAVGGEDVLSVHITCGICRHEISATAAGGTRPGNNQQRGKISSVEAEEDVRPARGGLLDWEDSSAPLPETAGKVRVQLSLQKEEAIFRSTMEQSFVVLCGVLFLTVSSQFFRIRKMLHPLGKLAAFTRRVGAGDIAERMPVDQVDEIADVAVAFNHMLDRLSLTTVSRDHVDNIIGSMSECLIVVSPEGKILTVNDATLELLGYSRVELVGWNVDVIVTGETAPLMRTVSSIEVEWRTRDGRSLPVLFSSAALRPNCGAAEGLVWLAQDITEQKRIREELLAAQERYALAVAGANDGIWDWNLITGEIYYSPRWKAMLGYRDDELPNTLDAGSALIHPEDRSRAQKDMEAHRIGATATFESDYRMLHADGRYRWMLCRGLAVRNAKGIATRVAGSLTDITQNKASDPLTGLPNRVFFTDRLINAFACRDRDQDYRFAVLFLDLDRFKMINDSLGHLAGDELLRGIAARLREGLSTDTGCAEATVARLGGDEFAVLMEGISDPDASQAGSRLGTRLLRGLSEPFFIEGREVFSSVSVGVAPATAQYHTPAEILRDADTAMYRAKALGKSRCEVFDAEMRSQAVSRLELDTDLRRAVERGGFEVVYQPKVSLADGCLTGFEALVRWRHPRRGLIAPSKFIPLAEETGLILPIGEMVLREACRQMRDWQKRYPAYAFAKLSVNLSPRQFLEPDLTAMIEEVLDTTGLDPSTLSLELTETVLIGDHESVREKLQRLKDLGIGLEIDDFGTGYSSLSYLHRFPFDVVKIDRSFVNNIENEEGAALVRAIVGLSHNLGMRVIAEGVETAPQLAILREAGCESGQGYYYSRPLTARLAERALSGERGDIRQSDLTALADHLGAETKRHEATVPDEETFPELIPLQVA